MTDPRLEAAAEASRIAWSGYGNWEGAPKSVQITYRGLARAALAAADNAATITTVEGLDALPAGSRIMLHCDLLLRMAEIVDNSNWLDLSNGCPVDNENLSKVLANVGHARVVQFGVTA